MGFETLIYEKKDGIAFITLNRPQRLNAIDTTMSRELPQAWDDVKQDPDVVVAIVTGAGERSLCTGFDMLDAAEGKSQVGEEGVAGTLCSSRSR